MTCSRFRVAGRFTPANAATITIDRASGLFRVRPLRCRRTYDLPLATVANLVVLNVARVEAPARRRRVRS